MPYLFASLKGARQKIFQMSAFSARVTSPTAAVPTAAPFSFHSGTGRPDAALPDAKAMVGGVRRSSSVVRSDGKQQKDGSWYTHDDVAGMHAAFLAANGLATPGIGSLLLFEWGC